MMFFSKGEQNSAHPPNSNKKKKRKQNLKSVFFAYANYHAPNGYMVANCDSTPLLSLVALRTA